LSIRYFQSRVVEGITRQCLAAMLALAFAGSAFAQDGSQCGSLDNGNNGPFDYRVERGRTLAVVEEFHFDARVEALIAGKSGAIGQDLDYVLRAFPNHHRALATMVKLAERTKSLQVPRAAFSVECYFERALRFRSNDTTTRMLYASYLNRIKRGTDAESQLDRVVELAGDNAFTHYNAGLIFVELGLLDRALVQAHKALALGFTRVDLRQQLEKAGKWKEPPTIDSAAPADAPASAASAPP